MLVGTSAFSQAAQINVLSATVKDKAISGATVIWQRSGSSSKRAITSASGVASLPGIVDDSSTTMLISKAGYSTLVVDCPCDGFTYALSPVMQKLDGMRVVLTWGRHPSDLDSHLVYPNNHVYFHHKQGSASNLDVDDTSSYGPETVTLTKRLVNQRYVYAVQDFTDGGIQSSMALAHSHARVDVYVGQTRIRTYAVDPTKNATTWVVFGIDENGAFHDINKYSHKPNSAIGNYLDGLITARSFEQGSAITDSKKHQAKQLNTKGEKLYHKHQLENAMYAFQDAVNRYPEYGQAYSNLGLTYQKLGRSAEALWANRKAIEIAGKVNNRRVQASSYYNIARIYEKKQQWQQALNAFRKAKSLRSHPAYDKGIARMEAKLGL